MVTLHITCSTLIPFLDDSHLEDNNDHTEHQSLVTEEEFASDDVHSTPEDDKNKLSLNEELGQLGVLSPPAPLSPDSDEQSTKSTQKGNVNSI